MRVNSIVFHYGPVDGFHIKGMAWNEVDFMQGAKVGRLIALDFREIV